MDAYREEFFGPVGVVYRVAGEDEAVEVANDTQLRSRLVRLHDRRGAGRARRRQDRRRHGLRQPRARRRAGAALRRRQALRHRRARWACWPPTSSSTRSSSASAPDAAADQRRASSEARASARASSAHCTCCGVPQRTAAPLRVLELGESLVESTRVEAGPAGVVVQRDVPESPVETISLSYASMAQQKQPWTRSWKPGDFERVK